MKVDLFDFTLPEDNIALRPLADREQAKLLHVNAQGCLADYHVRDLLNLLRPGDILVFNDTKVIPACLQAVRRRLHLSAGQDIAMSKKAAREQQIFNHPVKINVNLHMPASENSWRAFVRPLKKLQIGDNLLFYSDNIADSDYILAAKLIQKYENGEVLLEFNKSGADLSKAITKFGKMPLPPYIASRRPQDDQDKKDYQTIFAKEEGAVAAPTASLHFTENLLAKIENIGIKHCFLTLHVGAGTFLPVKVEDTKHHNMHSEIGYLSSDTAALLNQVKQQKGRIIAVGTTVLRLLESATDQNGVIHDFAGSTDIFITPSYKFRFVDCLITNFHLPKSTLYMLVCAFNGMQNMKDAYNHAIKNNYRFYSYGDSSFLERNDSQDY